MRKDALLPVLVSKFGFQRATRLTALLMVVTLELQLGDEDPSEWTIEKIAEVTGWSERRVYRIRADAREAFPAFDGDVTAVARKLLEVNSQRRKQKMWRMQQLGGLPSTVVMG